MALAVPLLQAADKKKEAAMWRTSEGGKTRNAERLLNSRLATFAAVLVFAPGTAMAQSRRAQSAKPIAEGHSDSDRRIIVSIPDRKLALIENGRVVKIYSIAAGAFDSPSPTGEFRITRRLTAPTYYAPGVVIPPGPENPLGPRWIGLNLKGYGIHGTNRPGSVGHYASHGCIRMRNRDVQELFELVRVGDAVELHGQRDAIVASVFGGGEARMLAVSHATSDESQPAIEVPGEDNH
jgi:lipoprotein-anchoring transpeptidase ErfK/SrfK